MIYRSCCPTGGPTCAPATSRRPRSPATSRSATICWSGCERRGCRPARAAGRSRRVNSLGEAPAPRARQSAPGCRRCPSR